MTENILKLYEIAKEYDVDLVITLKACKKNGTDDPVIFVRATNNKGLSRYKAYIEDYLHCVKPNMDVLFEDFKHTLEEMERS